MYAFDNRAELGGREDGGNSRVQPGDEAGWEPAVRSEDEKWPGLECLRKVEQTG